MKAMKLADVRAAVKAAGIDAKDRSIAGLVDKAMEKVRGAKKPPEEPKAEEKPAKEGPAEAPPGHDDRPFSEGYNGRKYATDFLEPHLLTHPAAKPGSPGAVQDQIAEEWPQVQRKLERARTPREARRINDEWKARLDQLAEKPPEKPAPAAKPPEAAKAPRPPEELAADPANWKAFREAYQAQHDATARYGGIVKVPELVDAMKAAGLTPEEAKATLLQWQDRGLLTLQKLNMRFTEPRADEGIDVPSSEGGERLGGNLFYARLDDDADEKAPRAAPAPEAPPAPAKPKRGKKK
jgi:hypothetical protein